MLLTQVFNNLSEMRLDFLGDLQSTVVINTRLLWSAVSTVLTRLT